MPRSLRRVNDRRRINHPIGQTALKILRTMSLFSLNSTNKCAKKRIPGLASTSYFGLFPEMDGFPDTVYQTLSATPENRVPGDKKKLGEAFTYLPGGFHRTVPLLVDTGDTANNSVGEIGSLMNEGIFRGFIEGDDDEVREWIDCLNGHSGCLHVVAKTKSGGYVSLGTPDYPVWVRSYAGGSGGGSGDARVGYNIELYTGYPQTYFSIDLSAFPLGLSPAA